MDCAKGINFLLTNGGAMSDYKGFGKATKPMLPSIGVPTTAGTGSEGQSFALIADEKTHLKMACGDRKAAFRVAILDPEVTVSQPRTVTAVTGIDAVSHALESYVTTRRNPLSQMFAREAWRLLDGNFERVLRQPGDLDARGAMQIGAHFAGVAIENSMLGVCHACANPLTAHYGLTHGIAIGVLLPHVVRFNAAAVGGLYGDLAHEVGLLNGDGAAAGEVLARRMTELLRAAGLPTRLVGVRRQFGHLPRAGRGSQPAVDRPASTRGRRPKRTCSVSMRRRFDSRPLSATEGHEASAIGSPLIDPKTRRCSMSRLTTRLFADVLAAGACPRPPPNPPETHWLVFRGNPLGDGRPPGRRPARQARRAVEVLRQGRHRRRAGRGRRRRLRRLRGRTPLRRRSSRTASKKWEYKAGPIKASPAYRDGGVYVGDSNGLFHCVDAANRPEALDLPDRGGDHVGRQLRRRQHPFRIV